MGPGAAAGAAITWMTLCVLIAKTEAQPPAPPAPLRCQNPDGTFLPSATVCSDEATTCADIFTGGTATARPTQCDNDDLASVALQCAKTCMICCETPEYNCEDSDCKPPPTIELSHEYANFSCSL